MEKRIFFINLRPYDRSLPNIGQSASEKHSQEKKPTKLCAPREFPKNVCHNHTILLFWLNNKQTFRMFSLRDLRFVRCSRDIDVLRAQRIIGFFNLNYPQINEVPKSDHVGGFRVRKPLGPGTLIRMFYTNHNTKHVNCEYGVRNWLKLLISLTSFSSHMMTSLVRCFVQNWTW